MLLFKSDVFMLMLNSFKLMMSALTVMIINRFFNLVDGETALAAGFCLEFHNPSALWTQPFFSVLAHHAANACGFYSFCIVKCVQIMSFDIFFGVFFH